MNTQSDLVAALAKSVDKQFSVQLIREEVALEEAFLLRKWKYTELDGGRFAEVAARIVYSVDSGNISRNKIVDDCLKYIDNDQVPHNFPERQSAIHLSKVLRAIYKLRSQRGAVHVSASYDANEIDSRLIVESVRWILAEFLRIFVVSDRDAVAEAIRNLARFPQPLIRMYGSIALLQSITFTVEEELLAHLLFSRDGLTTSDLITAAPRDPTSIRRSLKKLCSATCRQIIAESNRWLITDLGIMRIEERIVREEFSKK